MSRQGGPAVNWRIFRIGSGSSSPLVPSPRSRNAVAVGVVFAISLDTLCQLIWKSAALRVPEHVQVASIVNWLASSPWVWVLLGVFALQLVNWLWVLERAELSAVQPLTALSYVSVVLCSLWLFHERLDATRVAGISLVIVGVVLVSVDAHSPRGHE
jgi:drug/metabolite transporter (DMT)-like permease